MALGMTKWMAPSHDSPRGVTILGSTGSVGQSTVDLIARDPASYRVEALVAGTAVSIRQAVRALEPVPQQLLRRPARARIPEVAPFLDGLAQGVDEPDR